LHQFTNTERLEKRGRYFGFGRPDSIDYKRLHSKRFGKKTGYHRGFFVPDVMERNGRSFIEHLNAKEIFDRLIHKSEFANG